MTTSTPPVGIDHLTTVPENFEPERDGETGEAHETAQERFPATSA